MEDDPCIDVGPLPYVAWPMKLALLDQKVKTGHKWRLPLPLRWSMVDRSLRIAVSPPIVLEEVVADEVPPFGQSGLVGMRVLLVSSPPLFRTMKPKNVRTLKLIK